jgi:signal transduction histidine kinase/ActR/RegA family two-component response regulator
LTPEQFQEVASLLPEPLLLLSGSGQILVANPSAVNLLNSNKQELQGALLAELVTDPPDKLTTYLRMCSKSRQRIIGSLSFRMADGQATKIRSEGAVAQPWSADKPALILLRLRPADTTASRFIELNKRIDQLAREIRERRRMEEEREQLLAREKAARREAEIASQAKDEFLATMSHELRTPLNAILGWARMLRNGKLDEPTTARALEVIERNAKLQAQLIDDVLDVSRIITGKLRLDVSPIHLSQVVESAVEVVRPAAESKQIRLQVVLDPKAGPVAGDANRLQQVIWNLLSNAIKFTPKNGRVQIRLERINSHVKLTVSDTGIGISPEFLPYVFDRFRQADSALSRKHGGLGLGLAIARQLVELHGGDVEVESPGEEQGATFIVRLPVIIAHNTSQLYSDTLRRAAQDREETTAFDCPPSLKGLRLLVAEDAADARELISIILKQCGAEVKAVESASKAFDEILEWQPDLLISDIEMPEEDGYSLIRKVRGSNLGKIGQIPAIALTAHVRVEDRVRALSAGFQSHVTKPVDPAELLAVIASLAKSSSL